MPNQSSGLDRDSETKSESGNKTPTSGGAPIEEDGAGREIITDRVDLHRYIACFGRYVAGKAELNRAMPLFTTRSLGAEASPPGEHHIA